MKSRRNFKQLGLEGGMWLLALIWSIPFLFLIVISVKPTEELFGRALSLPSRIDLSSYVGAWTQGGMGKALLSSIIITAGSVLGLLALSSAAAYVLARRTSRASSPLLLVFLVGLIVPAQLGLIPTYSAFRHLGLVGSYTGMILLNVSLWLPLAPLSPMAA